LNIHILTKSRVFSLRQIGALLAQGTTQQTRGRNGMNKHRLHGVIVGGIFAALITWVAGSDALAQGGFALLASVVFGLSAGICIGSLIAANFFLLAAQEEHRAVEPTRTVTELRPAA
jgi:uncharacterized membrane protein